MAYFTLPGERSPFASTPRPRRRKAQPQQKQQSGGFLADLAGGAGGILSDIVPDLGIGNLGKMAVGAVPGLYHLATDWATKGLGQGDFSTYSKAGEGLLQSFANTGATIAKPLGGDFWYEPLVKETTGYKPQDILERARNQNIGLLPALVEDVGNAALVGGAATKVLKAGEVGTMANEARLAEEAATAGNSTRVLKQYGRAVEKAQKLRDAGVAVPEEQVASRVSMLNKAETVAHPYEALAKRVIRPIAQAGTERVLATGAAEGQAAATGAERMTTAERLVADAAAGNLSTITDADAIAHLRETKQAVTKDAIEASRAQLAELQAGSRPVSEDLALYRDSNPDLGIQPKNVEHAGDWPEGDMRAIADAYDDPAFHNPQDPRVRAAYLGDPETGAPGLLEQVKRQYQMLTRPKEQGGLGVQVDMVGPDVGEYRSAAEMRADLEQNGHLNVRSTALNGDTTHEFMAMVDPETGLSYNDMWRAVHDAFGHSKSNDFGRAGELTSFREHSQWFNENAQPAVANEAIGQGASLIKNGKFPEQKAGIIPPELLDRVRNGPSPEVKSPPDPARPMLMGRQGMIEGVEPAYSPTQQVAEAQRLAGIPGWSKALVDRLPMPVVRTLDRVNGLIAAHDVKVVARERARIVEVARRAAISDPAVQQAVTEIGLPMLNKTLPDGTLITRQVAQDLIGAEIMARLDMGDMLTQAGGAMDPIIANELNNVLSQGKRIPPALIDELGLEPALQQVTDHWRRMADERVATLIGGRLGTKGLEGIGEDVPTMTKRQVQAWKQMQRLMRRKLKMQARLEGEAASMTNKAERIQSSIDRVTAAAEKDTAAAQAADREARALYDQQPFGDNPAVRDRAVADLADSTMGDRSGGTIDTVTGELLNDQTYAVAARPGTMRQVTAAEFAQRGPDILKEVLDSDGVFRDPRIRLGTWRHALDEDTVINGEVVPAGTEVVDIDPSIDTWAADPNNPKSPWQKLTREQAIVVAHAMGQDSVYDARNGTVIWTKADDGVNNMNSHFVDLALNPRSQFSTYDRQLRNAIYDQTAARSRDPQGWGPYLPPAIGPEDADALMQAHMQFAYTLAKAKGAVDEFGNPTKKALDDYFRQKRIAFNKAKAPRLKLERGFTQGANKENLAQVMLNLDVNDPTLVQHMIDMTPNAEARLRWYNQSHDGIERLARGREIVLGDGTKIDAADLLYQLIAVTSFQADPLTNLGNALHAVGNWHDLQAGTTKMRDAYISGMQEYLKLPPEEQTYERLINTLVPEGKTTGRLPQKLSKNAGMYSKKGNHIKAITAILSGHTLDKWDPQTVMDFSVPWGGATKSKKGGWERMLADIPEETWQTAREEAQAFGGDETAVQQRALALHYGDRAWGKILSFWQNLADPEASRAVTLDTWMARAFGMQSWSSPGDYWEYTRRLTAMADAAGIQPHQLQALIWTYAKNEITRQAHARVWATTTQATEMLADGARLGGEGDPILARLDWELGRPAEFDQELADWQAAPKETRGPRPTKAKVEQIKGAHGEEILYSRKTGGEDITKLQETRDNYLAAAEEANRLAAEGDVQGAQRVIAKWTTDYFKSTAQAEKSGDFMDFLLNPNARVSDAARRAGFSETDLARVMDESLMQSVEGAARGFTMFNDQADRALIQFFSTADVATLFHENAHALRQILPVEDIKTLERAFGQPGIFLKSLSDPLQAPLRRAAEELFVEEFMSYLVSGRASGPGMQPIMEKLRDAFRDGHKQMTQRGSLAVEIPEDMNAVWDKYLDPVLPSEPQATLLDTLGEASARTAPEDVSTEMLAARNRPLPGESPADALRRQRRMDRQIESKHFLEHRAAERMKRVARLQKAKAEFEDMLRTGATPLQAEIDKFDKRINRLGERLAAELEDPKTSLVPPVWQPLKQAMDELWDRAKDDPTLAAHMEGMPKTFGDILRLAAEKGFDPTHIRSFTPRQVEGLVHETIRLGVPGRNVGEEIIAGTRKPRVNGIPRTQSLDALVAATVEATHEVQTNELVSFIEGGGIAQPVINGVIPNGWEAWDPIKRWFVNGEEQLPSGKNVKRTPAPTLMVPKSAANALRNMGKSYNHWAFRALGKPSSWWRTFILTLSPRWYVNNFIGNFAMATAEGVGLKDWAAAWKSYRQRGEGAGLLQRGAREGMPFRDVPGVTGASIYHELDEPTMIPPQQGTGAYGTRNLKGLLKDIKGQPVGAKWKTVKARVSRANEVVDEIARSAVYHRTVRVTGSHELAIQRAYQAMVDYGDLGPLERTLVRAVVPFYAWQKGILKRMASIGYHDPAVFALMQRLTDLNEEILKDQYGAVPPEGYQGIISLPGGGAINTRGFNPFQDAGQLIRAQGIAESANPIIEALVRNELGAPTTSRPEDYRINPFGRLVPETNVGQDLAQTFSSGLPQGQLALALAGQPQYPGAAPAEPVQQAERFVGVNTLTPQQIRDIIQRTRESRATLSGKKVKKASSAFQKFAGRDFQPFQIPAQ